MKNISVIVPIFNEEEILEVKTIELYNFLEEEFDNFQIILSENGSKDKTKEIAKKLQDRFAEIGILIDDTKADYGEALIEGIRYAIYEECAIMEIDYLDFDFLVRGYNLLNKYDLIVGSKKISPGVDQRSWKRKFFTWFYNFLLKISFNVKITETHGLKVFNKSKIYPISEKCISRHAVYPSELVIKAHLDMNVNVIEIPLSLPLREIRTTRIKALKRFKSTIKDLLLLKKIIR
jgi:glycosyltransferase involved in cell wall biosynthesis